MILRRIFLILLLFLASGCGYHLPGGGEGPSTHLRTVYIDSFANLTTEPFIETRVTNAVIESFARRKGMHPIEREGRSEAKLSGSITAYTSSAISYDRLDRVVEYRSSMTIEASLLRESDGRTLWKGSLSRSEEYLSSDDKVAQEDNEDRAIAIICDRLAEDLHVRLMDDF